jgi:hypothetical protein
MGSDGLAMYPPPPSQPFLDLQAVPVHTSPNMSPTESDRSTGEKLRCFEYMQGVIWISHPLLQQSYGYKFKGTGLREEYFL